MMAAHSRWQDPIIDTVTYCTARVSGASNPVGQREQDVYLRALERSGSVTQISYGNYVARVATEPLATAGRNGKPVISHPRWPLMVQDGAEQDVPDARFMASVAHLAYPIAFARGRVPIGLVNPTKGYRAGMLAGEHTDGVGDHWWYQLQPSDWYAHQLPPMIGARISKPPEW